MTQRKETPMRLRFEWEAIDSQTLRAKVWGGWLVRYHSHSGAVAMTWVPDVDHAWQAEVSPDLLAKSGERLSKLEHDVQDLYLDPNTKGEMEQEIEILRRLIEQQQ